MASEPATLDLSNTTCFSTSKRLENGLTVVEVLQPHLRRCSISAYLRIGSRFEEPLTNGLSHFVEHMLFRGTQRHPSAYEVNLAVETLGGNLAAATSPATTELEMMVPPKHVLHGLGLFYDILTRPVFREIDIERRVIAEEVIEDLDEAGNCVDIDFLSRSRLWSGHPLGQSVTGPLANVEGFDRRDVERHFRNHYVAGNAVLCVSGSFDPDTVGPRVEALFADFPSNGVTTLSTAPDLGVGPSVHHTPKPGSQTHVRVAFHAPGEDSADSVALMTLLGVLDDGMSSRLHRRIFDERGLAYNIGAGLDSYADVSALNFDATASHDNVEEVVREILSVAEGLCDRPFPEDELRKARDRAAFGIEELMDDPQAMSLWYGEQRLFRRPVSLEARIREHESVVAADVTRVARQVFTAKNLHITTVGTVSRETEHRIARAALNFS